MYVTTDRKLESGLGIQNMAHGQIDIMLRLLLVKSGEGTTDESPHASEQLYGAQALMDLVSSWANLNRLVCADSYVDSVRRRISFTKMD